MDIILHIAEKKLDECYDAAISEYFKRTSAFANIKKKLYKDISKLQLEKSSYIFVLDYGCNTLTSTELAKKISGINLAGFSCIEFIITSDSSIVKDNLNCQSIKYDILTLSTMKLNNNTASVCLAEQIYRAYTINNNISYHK